LVLFKAHLSLPASPQRLRREADSLRAQNAALDALLRQEMEVSGKWRLWSALKRAFRRLEQAASPLRER
jgi:hypothetical protein